MSSQHIRVEIRPGEYITLSISQNGGQYSTSCPRCGQGHSAGSEGAVVNWANYHGRSMHR